MYFTTTESGDDGSGSSDDLEEFSGSGSGFGDLTISTTTTTHSIKEMVTDSGTIRPTIASGSSRNPFSIYGPLLCLLVTFVLSSPAATRVHCDCDLSYSI